MTCESVVECMNAILSAQLAQSSDSPSLLEAVDVAATFVLAAVGTVIAWRVFRFESRRALIGDRDALRADLREWQKAISRTASRKQRQSRGRLRASIEELADAENHKDVLRLMRWVVTMEETSYEQVDQGRLEPAAAHDRRIIVKRRFRQLAAFWSRHPFLGRRMIRAYTSRGWNAIMDEPIGAVTTLQALNTPRQWKRIPRQSR